MSPAHDRLESKSPGHSNERRDRPVGPREMPRKRLKRCGLTFYYACEPQSDNK